jgi:hypothetical protein
MVVEIAAIRVQAMLGHEPDDLQGALGAGDVWEASRHVDEPAVGQHPSWTGLKRIVHLPSCVTTCGSAGSSAREFTANATRSCPG